MYMFTLFGAIVIGVLSFNAAFILLLDSRTLVRLLRLAGTRFFPSVGLLGRHTDA